MEISTEVEFAQRLASNEKKQRDKAIKKLRKYIAAKSSVGFSEDDYLKICKGLHYCMWMQDKPLIQEELSTNISRLVHIQQSYKQALLFIKVFFQTEAREWDGIDYWRMDKFMMFLRNMVNQSFLYLKNRKWEKPVIKLFVDVVNDTLLDYTSDVIPDGIRIHLADIYLSELNKVGGDQLTPKQIVHFLTPFVTFIHHSKNLNIVHRVVSGIFYPLISQTIAHFRKQQEKETKKEKKVSDKDKKSRKTDDDDDDDDTDDEDMSDAEDDSKLSLKFDCYLIADQLFAAGSSPDCPARNRKLLYKLVKRLRDAADGVLPKIPQDIGDTKVEMKDINRAVQALQTMEYNILDQNKKTKKKNKDDLRNKKKMADLKSCTQDESVLLPNGKRKKKSSVETVNKKIKTSMDATTTNLQDKRVKNKKSTTDAASTNLQDKRVKNKKSTIDAASTKQQDKIVKNKKSTIDAKSTKQQDKTVKNKKSTMDAASTKQQDKTVKNKKSTMDAASTKQQDKTVKNKKSTMDATSTKQQDKTVKNKKSTMDAASTKQQDKTVKNKTSTNATSTKLQDKTIEKVQSIENRTKETVKSVTKKKQKKTVNENEQVKGDNHVQTRLAEDNESNLTKKKFKKKENIASDFGKTVLNDTERDSSVDVVDNALQSSKGKKKKKTEDVLLDKTSPVKSAMSSTKMTKTKSKQKHDDVADTSVQPSIVKNLMDEFLKPLEEGEVEIFVHSKKWKEKMKSSPVECGTGKKSKKPESAFAHFEKLSQTPPAFVRKADAPHTMPRKRKLQMAEVAPMQSFSTGKKRVSFDPSRNMSRDFKDSVNFSSDPAYLPEKSPSQGILKSPGPSSSKKKKKATKKDLKNIFTSSNKSPEAVSVNTEIKSTPSRKTPRKSDINSFTRPTAADFF